METLLELLELNAETNICTKYFIGKSVLLARNYPRLLNEYTVTAVMRQLFMKVSFLTPLDSRCQCPIFNSYVAFYIFFVLVKKALYISDQVSGGKRVAQNGFMRLRCKSMFVTNQCSLIFCVVVLIVFFGLPVTASSADAKATEAATENEVELEEVIIIGSRSRKPRTVTDSPVPIDVFLGEEIDSLGNTADITDNLKALLPSFIATPATGDGSAFVRHVSLRGMAPDQMLLMVNGKRRHRAALVHFLSPAGGNGAHGPDLGMIPSIAIKSVEVLRDGAAAQYGSDAIAGVININLKDTAQGGAVQVHYGRFYEGETSTKIAANGGLALGENGFFNISFERMDNEALSRGIQRPDGQALIDDGAVGVGADTPYDDEPFVQSWGRPKTSATRFFFNQGYNFSDDLQLYTHGNYARTKATLRFFYRNTEHSTLATLVADYGYSGALLETGYTPYLDGSQTDTSLVSGIKGQFDGGVSFDFSAGYGNNQLDYFLNNTTNPSLGLANGEPLQRGFDVGGYEQEEINLNADFSLEFNSATNLAFGAEWREETYTVIAGEPNSYLVPGSNGLPGFRPEDAGAFSRDNYALYVDVEQDITEPWMVQYALRYENFSDFGNTLNGKLASRLQILDSTYLRSSISTGFHAPTPGQSNVRTTITTFDTDSGLQVDEGLIRPTSEQAIAEGGAPLKEEESFGVSIGLTHDFGPVNLSMDLYQTTVDDRIYRTGDIHPLGDDGLPDEDISISFFTNALDMRHTGFDLVAGTNFSWGSADSILTDMTFAFNYNKVEVINQSPVGGIKPVSDAVIEDIENNFPNLRYVLSANSYFYDHWSFLLRINYYGSHYDERGTINDVDVNNRSAKIDSVIFVDINLRYDFHPNMRLTLGGINIFDEYVDEVSAPNANRRDVGLPYPRRSAANYEGGSVYLSLEYHY